MGIGPGGWTGIRRQRNPGERIAERVTVGLGHVEMYRDTTLIRPDGVDRGAVVAGLDPRPDALLDLARGLLGELLGEMFIAQRL